VSAFNEDLTREMIVRLVNTCADVREAKPGTKAFAVATAHFTGMAHGAHFALRAMGISPGAAPFAVEMDVIDAIRAHGDRPPHSTMNAEYKVWLPAVTDDLLAKWVAA